MPNSTQLGTWAAGNLHGQAEMDEFTRLWIVSCRPQVEEDWRRLRELGVVDEQETRSRQMIFAAGPPGGRKSSALSIKQLGVDWFNAHDRDAKVNAGSYHKISPAIRKTASAHIKRCVL
jgi:hypothetical protein